MMTSCHSGSILQNAPLEVYMFTPSSPQEITTHESCLDDAPAPPAIMYKDEIGRAEH
jgi:hypothetical protein